MTIGIDYRLTGAGWAECEVSTDDEKRVLTASYLSDALGNMVLAAVALLKGFSAVSFAFEEEPGEYRWSIRQLNGECCRIKIFWFRDSYLHREDDAGEQLLATDSNPVEFGEAVYRAADRIRQKHGEAGYLAQWHEHPFPAKELDTLRIEMRRWGHEI